MYTSLFYRLFDRRTRLLRFCNEGENDTTISYLRINISYNNRYIHFVITSWYIFYNMWRDACEDAILREKRDVSVWFVPKVHNDSLFSVNYVIESLAVRKLKFQSSAKTWRGRLKSFGTLQWKRDDGFWALISRPIRSICVSMKSTKIWANLITIYWSTYDRPPLR